MRPSLLSSARSRTFKCLATLALLGPIGAGLAETPARAADPIQSVLYTVGTTTPVAGGANWDYLLWASGNLDGLMGRAFAVYSKPGSPAGPGTFTRVAIVRQETDAAVLASLLQQAQTLGASSGLLESDVDALFGRLRLPATASLPEKLAVVLRAALGDRDLYQRLLLLGRLHPAVTLGLGLGLAVAVPPGDTTFEVRRLDPAGREEGVVGRVTITTGAPVILPAPGAPLQVEPPPQQKALGHSNAQFQWTIPDPLKRLSVLNQGLDLYRVTRAYAEQQGWQLAPPPRGRLATLAASFPANSPEPDVKRVNRVPLFTPTETASPTLAFVVDDNDPATGARPFRNGEEFYYYLAARDVLGRNGDTSPGLRVRLCDRVMPQAPARVQVDNTLVSSGNAPAHQALRVRWETSPDSGDVITRFHVYRWRDAAGPLTDNLPADGHPNRIGVITPAPGESEWRFVDDGLLSPRMPADAGRTFFYTVRAEDDGACGGNLSPHSGPMFGVLRDREAPAAPAGQLQYTSCRPEVVKEGTGNRAAPGSDPAQAFFQLRCPRQDAAIRWVELYRGGQQAADLLARHVFVDGEMDFQFDWSLARSAVPEGSITFHCRAGSVSDGISGFVEQTGLVAPNGTLTQVSFRARTVCRSGTTGVFVPHPPGSTTSECVTIALTPPADASEVRVYRQTDSGERTLVSVSGSGPTNVQDCVSPPVGAQVCYFAQTVDSNGNASALAPIGNCLLVQGSAPLPTPFLLTPAPQGSVAAPLMVLRWICSPYGLARFRVYVASAAGERVDGPLSAQLGPRRGEEPGVIPAEGGDRSATFGEFESTVIGGAVGAGPQFAVPATIALNREYFIYVRAVARDGTLGPRSNLGKFRWSPPERLGPNVPWPAWPLPAASPADATIRAVRLPTDEYPAGVRIGAWARPSGTTTETGTFPGKIDPAQFLYPQAGGAPLLPVALYRYQVANAGFPSVSGDVLQVSPLIERLAHEQRSLPNGSTETILRDPFIEVLRPPGDAADSLVLRDTQPVLNGARYVYLVVCFDPVSHEIVRTIATNELEP